MFKITIVFYFLSFLLQYTTGCKNDVECGYGVYSVCEKKEFEIYPGIGYSNEDNKVYLLGRFNTSSELKYIVSISGDGVTSLTGEFPVLTDSFTDAHTTQELLFYNQNTNTPFLVSLNRNFYGYGPYFKVNNTFNYVWTTKYYPLAVYYDDQDTYLVNNYLQKINKNGTTFVMLKMPLVGVRHLWTVGDYLYFIHRHTIGRIDKSCIECNQMETLLSLPFTPYAFERSSTHFYFGVTSGYFGVASDQPGLYELPINGPITSLKKLLVNSIQGLVFNREKTKLFISTTDNTLFRIDQLPGNPVIIELHSHNNGSGTCICNSYFSGTDCKKCFSDNVVSNNGTLSCEFKSPSEYQPCYLDSQCLNKKLSYCEGFCKCRNSFSGINCDICSSGNVTTDRGIERCEV